MLFSVKCNIYVNICVFNNASHLFKHSLIFQCSYSTTSWLGNAKDFSPQIDITLGIYILPFMRGVVAKIFLTKIISELWKPSLKLTIESVSMLIPPGDPPPVAVGALGFRC